MYPEKKPFEVERLKSFVREGAILVAVDLSIQAEIPLGPLALVVSSYMMHELYYLTHSTEQATLNAICNMTFTLFREGCFRIIPTLKKSHSAYQIFLCEWLLCHEIVMEPWHCFDIKHSSLSYSVMIFILFCDWIKHATCSVNKHSKRMKCFSAKLIYIGMEL